MSELWALYDMLERLAQRQKYYVPLSLSDMSGEYRVVPTLSSSERGKLGVVSHDGYVYAIGGFESSTYTNSCKRFDVKGSSWATKASMPTARIATATTLCDDKIYVIGGTKSGGVSKNVEIYDPALNKWTTGQSVPKSLSDICAASHNSIIYIPGGSIEYSGLSAECLAYNTITDTWSTKANMPDVRRGQVAAQIDGVIYVIGGWTNDADSAVKTNWAYNTTTNTWSAKADMPAARFGMGGAVHGSSVYVVGGRAGTTNYSTVYSYNSGSNYWSTRASMPTTQSSHGAAFVDDVLYVVGGEPQGQSFAYYQLSNYWVGTCKVAGYVYRDDIIYLKTGGAVLCGFPFCSAQLIVGNGSEHIVENAGKLYALKAIEGYIRGGTI